MRGLMYNYSLLILFVLVLSSLAVLCLFLEKNKRKL